jgi:hypothetical protein
VGSGPGHRADARGAVNTNIYYILPHYLFELVLSILIHILSRNIILSSRSHSY